MILTHRANKERKGWRTYSENFIKIGEGNHREICRKFIFFKFSTLLFVKRLESLLPFLLSLIVDNYIRKKIF